MSPTDPKIVTLKERILRLEDLIVEYTVEKKRIDLSSTFLGDVIGNFVVSYCRCVCTERGVTL